MQFLKSDGALVFSEYLTKHGKLQQGLLNIID